MLKQLAQSQKCSQDDIAIILKTQQSEVSKMMNGHRKITDEHISLLIERFGKDVVDAYIVDDDIVNLHNTPQARQVYASIVPAEVVEEIREEVRAEIIKAESVPYVPSRIANNTQVKDIREYIEKKGDELERIKPGDLVGEPDSAERVRKTSMSPTFNPGDVVFVQFLDNIRNITDGQIYYFKMATRPTMIRRVKIEGEHLRLVADNPSFGDIITTYDEIVNVADIVGMFRSSFGNQYAEIEALRAKKEQQIDNLIDEIRDAGKRTDVLMSQNLELMKKLLEK